MNRKTAILAGVLAFSLGVLASACDSDEELTLEAYFAQVETILQESDVEEAALEGTIAGAFEEGPATADFINAVVAVRRKANAMLEDLDPPSEAEGAHDQFVFDTAKLLEAAETFATLVEAAETSDELEQIFADETSPFDAAQMRLEDACRALQSIAESNGIAVELSGENRDCEADVPKVSEDRGLIDVGNGRQLYLACAGEGSPTVVMEAGGAGNSESWRLVQPEVAKFTRVCTYDRAGTGLSSSVPRHGSIQAIVQELHSLLEAAGVRDPYILVGHSLGGIIVLQFAATYENEIVGMVMVDSSGNDPRPRIEAALTPEEWQRYGSTSHEGDFVLPEGVDLPPPYMRDTPLVVLSAGISSSDLPRDLAEKLNNVRLEMHRELLDLSTNSAHMIAEDSDHAIPSNQPSVVTDAIRKVVEAVRNETAL